MVDIFVIREGLRRVGVPPFRDVARGTIVP